MFRSLKAHAWLLTGTAWALSGCAVVKHFEHACTEIGCSDGALIQINLSAGDREGRALRLELDGTVVTCQKPALDRFDTTCSASEVRTELLELTDCVETRTATAVSQSCTRNGKVAQQVSLRGTPQLIELTLDPGGETEVTRRFEPSYKTFEPNGPECEPTCQGAEETWNLTQ